MENQTVKPMSVAEGVNSYINSRGQSHAERNAKVQALLTSAENCPNMKEAQEGLKALRPYAFQPFEKNDWESPKECHTALRAIYRLAKRALDLGDSKFAATYAILAKKHPIHKHLDIIDPIDVGTGNVSDFNEKLQDKLIEQGHEELAVVIATGGTSGCQHLSLSAYLGDHDISNQPHLRKVAHIIGTAKDIPLIHKERYYKESDVENIGRN